MRLLFLNGPRSGGYVSLASQETRIGRETDNDIQLLVSGVSRYHALIRKEENSSWSLRDLGSTNGTKVNGSVIGGTVVLHPGDVILIGDQQIRMEEDSSSGAPQDGEKEKEREKEKASSPAPEGGEKEKEKEKASQSGPVPAVRFHTGGGPSGESAGGKEKKKSSSSPDKGGSAGKKADLHFDNPDTAILESIFNDPPADGSSPSGELSSGASSAPEGRKKKVLGSLLFYVILCSVAAVCVALFLYFNQEKSGNTAVPAPKKDPNKFFLAYEKETLTKSSIFRFELFLECCWEKSADKDKPVLEEAAFVRYSVAEQKAEDSISYKYVLPRQRIDLEDAERLRKKIQDTEFMKLGADSGDIVPETGGKSQSSRITVGFNGHLNSVAVSNTSPKRSYRDVEELIEQFTEDTLGVRTVSMSVEEMQEEAKKHFAQAREYFENYEAKPENLRLAIKRFRLTSQMLERFQPRPKMWSEANAYLQKAEKLLKDIRNKTYADLKIKLKLKEYPEALEKAKLLLDYLEPGSSNYQRIRDVKISIERELARDKRRK